MYKKEEYICVLFPSSIFIQKTLKAQSQQLLNIDPFPFSCCPHLTLGTPECLESRCLIWWGLVYVPLIFVLLPVYAYSKTS